MTVNCKLCVSLAEPQQVFVNLSKLPPGSCIRHLLTTQTRSPSSRSDLLESWLYTPSPPQSFLSCLWDKWMQQRMQGTCFTLLCHSDIKEDGIKKWYDVTQMEKRCIKNPALRFASVVACILVSSKQNKRKSTWNLFSINLHLSSSEHFESVFAHVWNEL